MEQITIDKKVYNIPTSWDQMNFGQFLKLSDYLKSINEIDPEVYPDNIFYSNVLTAIADAPKNSFIKLNIADVHIVKKAIEFISTKFENDTYSKTLEHQNLIIKVKNFDELIYGEYIDMLHISSNTSELNLINLLAVMCDVYKKKDIKKFIFKDKKIEFSKDEKEELIKALPATKANAIVAFFLRGQKQSQRNMVSSLHLVVMRLAMKASLQTVGLIISGLWMRVMRILLSLMMLLTFRLDRCLLIWRTKLPRII
jgi:hypothetical protein